MCKINLNKELNGIELSFESKPERATLDAIKAQGFKWNGRKMVWYAKQTADRLTFAQTLGQIEKAPKAAEVINMTGVGAKTKNAYGADFAKIVREELKNRGVKGVTVRAKKSGYTDSITITVKATQADFASLEEFKSRYSFGQFSCDISIHGRYTGSRWIYSAEWEKLTEEEQKAEYNNYCKYEITSRHSYNEFHRERKNYPQFTTAFCEKLNNIFVIANQWNWDNSDSMTDYFDIGYYLDIDIKTAEEIQAREEMTETERNAYEAEKAAEEAEREAAAAEYMRRIEEERKASEEADKRRKDDEELIYNTCIIEDLDETEQIYVANMITGIGKECDLDDLNRTINEYSGHYMDCLITRKVIFPTVESFEAFARNLLNDFVFLSGKGGTASQDVRLEAIDSLHKLTEEQRATVKIYCNDCVGIYCGEELKLVSDPEGYNYSRYTYIMTENSDQKPAAEVLQDQKSDSMLKDAFYFPAPVEEQAAQLHEGQEITIYQCDGWILNSINAGSGIVTGFYTGDYAQYKGLWITLLNGMKEKRVFIHNGRKCLIYEGIKPALPEEVTRRKVSANMYEMYNADVLLPNAYNYYLSQGITPIIDTCAR